MKRAPGIIFCSLALLTTADAQSGRRFEKPESTPPSAQAGIEKVPDFSESTPLPKRPKAPAAMRQAAESDKHKKDPAPANNGTTIPAPENGELVLKVETDLITIPVSVFDRNGLYVPNLQQSDFKIF